MASPPPRIVDPANLQALFYKIMERYQVKANEISNLKEAIVYVHGRGLFDCFNCHHSFNSHYSWVKMDLKTMAVIYRWRMKCLNCYRGHPTAAGPGIKPTFGVEEMEKMIEKAVCLYKGVDFPKKINSGRRRFFSPPHFKELCEKCGWGQIECWTLKPYGSFKT